jgi:hypothetical protein
MPLREARGEDAIITKALQLSGHTQEEDDEEEEEEEGKEEVDIFIC